MYIGSDHFGNTQAQRFFSFFAVADDDKKTFLSHKYKERNNLMNLWNGNKLNKRNKHEKNNKNSTADEKTA